MHRRRCRRLASYSLILAMMMGVVLADRALAAADARPLQLEVYVNDTDARLIGTFTQLADRRIAATRGELTELGIAVPGAGAADEVVAVDDLKGVCYRYDAPGGDMFLQLGDAHPEGRGLPLRRAGAEDLLPARRRSAGAAHVRRAGRHGKRRRAAQRLG